ncbi:MAG: tRNA guanosine(34) transglycosylase Tgt [Acidobacteriaceae bacterium]
MGFPVFAPRVGFEGCKYNRGVPLSFEIHSTDGSARRATLTLPHGAVQTPVFMPVGTAATVKAVPQELLETVGNGGRGAEIILANTYHLYLRPGHEVIRRLGGVHRFMGWQRPMLTDSGGFQVFSLSKLRKVTADGVEFRSHLDGSKHFFSPEHSMDVQIALGADIMMAFDECTEYPATRERARQSLDLTLAWAKRSLDHFREHCREVPWFGDGLPGQGEEPMSQRRDMGHPDLRLGLESEGREEPVSQRRDMGHPDSCLGSGLDSCPDSRLGLGPGKEHPTLRDETARGWGTRVGGREELSERTQSLFGIVQGGMHQDLRRESAERLVEMDFPGYAIGGLSVGEPRERTREIIEATLPYLPKDKPRYVMGVGYPDEIVEYAALGVDMMDCVLPTRAARHGLLFTSQGRINIKGRAYAEDSGPLDPLCGCMVCRRYSRAYLRHLFVSKETLAAVLNSVHNLAYFLDTMRKVRDAMESGTLPELLAQVRSRAGAAEG